MITSKNNPLVKETASLKDKKGRKALGSFLVEGHKMSIECLGSPLQIERVFLTHSYAETYGSLFPEEICVYVSDGVMAHLCDEKTPQGVLCRVKIPAQTVEKPTEKCLLLDGVSDPGNMGAIIRTANQAGAHGVIIPKRRAVGLTATVARTSAGALNYTPVAKVTNLVQTMEELKKEVLELRAKDLSADGAKEEKKD